MHVLALSFLFSRTPQELGTYLKAKDPAFSFSVDPANHRLELTSQKWQGNLWTHNVLFEEPSTRATKGVAVLFITGGEGKNSDLPFVQAISNQAHLPTYVLFGIPKQPLYGGLTEDRLIAYTFQKYLDTKDGTWPLLFPMTKAAIRAMDAIEAATLGTENPIHKFIVSGASKRGWTTWLVGSSGDRRVVGIAPMVIDNLNLNAQMKKQVSEWGKFSEQIEAYTERRLQEKLASPEGKRLAEMVDPYSYRSAISAPTLIVKGANDPYWTVDALDEYWNQLKEPKWVVTVPNAGHGLGDKTEALETLGAFARTVATGAKMPEETYDISPSQDGGACNVGLQTHGARHPKKAVAWVATSDDLDFRKQSYSVACELACAKDHASGKVDLPAGKNVAIFIEATYEDAFGTYRLCSPTKLIRSAAYRPK